MVVERVLFDDARRAVGVTARVNGRAVTYSATSKVILCAGALLSPAILQRSGIGPADVLRHAGVTPIVDSPDVGRRMRDHLGFSMPYRLRGAPGNNREFHGRGLWRNIARYYLRRDGPLANGPFEVGAFVRLGPNSVRADAQLYMARSPPRAGTIISRCRWPMSNARPA